MSLIRYFFPRRKLYHVPKHVTALYNRGEITHEQALVMSAGYARDPQQAASVLNELRKQHGRNVWNYLLFNPRRKRVKTVYERFLTLMRRMFGELEYPVTTARKQEAIVYMDYEFDEQ